jgi:hypothetical protein
VSPKSPEAEFGMPGPVSREAHGLRFEFSAMPTSAFLELFYEGYDRSFVLANEKETLEGIRECLDLNANETGRRLTARYGPAREFVAIARDNSQTGSPVIGGANFITFVTDDRCPYLSNSSILTHLNYVYVLPEFRGAGFLGKIVRHVSDTAAFFGQDLNKRGQLEINFFKRAGRRIICRQQQLIFIEQNDPYRLSDEQYAADTSATGIDQFTRLSIWSGLNAKLIDFPYIQPPLSSGQEADITLALAVLGVSQSNSLHSCLLRAHLERYFAITVLKGWTDPHVEPTSRAQLDALEDACRQRRQIALFEISRSVLKEAFEARRAGRFPDRKSLRDLFASL